MSAAGTTVRAGATVVVPVLRSGILAEDFCRRGAGAEVAAVFERTFYLASGGTFICVGEPAIGNGPLTLTARLGTCRDLRLRPHQPAVVCAGHIAIGNTVLAFGRCEPWRPPAWPRALSARELIDISRALASRAAREAPPEGFAAAVLENSCTPGTRGFAGIASRRIAAFASWLSDALSCGQVPAPPIEGLIGLGPGLTPSGDDFLAGALALLDALGETRAHAILAQAIKQSAPSLTSPLSACLLGATAAGHVGEHLHAAVSSIISGRVDDAIAACRLIGHSSGWDMMAGIATALRIVGES
jgi:uncharacterized protein DUF2877